MDVTFRKCLGAVAASIGLVAVLDAPVNSQKPATIIAYGDTRFTDPTNVTATNPQARTALTARIAEHQPDAIVMSGDVPWHGGTKDDYAQFVSETAVWRSHNLRVLPALGNHEFSQCLPEACLENWWRTFPELRGKRWYATDVTPQVRVVALDSVSPLLEGSEQRLWLEREITTLPPSVQFVIVALHHPPVADIQTRLRLDHNPRPNELALAAYLKEAARVSRARFVVVAGHIHNYERFFQDGIVYLVLGGGGAVPYEVDRTPPDLYKHIDFPNFHYVKLSVAGGTLTGEMYRLDEPSAPVPHFTLKDKFSVDIDTAKAASVRSKQ
jgi:3',5'-cyclic AMP phosphodiesterase CpdA